MSSVLPIPRAGVVCWEYLCATCGQVRSTWASSRPVDRTCERCTGGRCRCCGSPLVPPWIAEDATGVCGRCRTARCAPPTRPRCAYWAAQTALDPLPLEPIPPNVPQRRAGLRGQPPLLPEDVA